MKCAEQVRNVYVRIQMWKTIYCYIISTIMSMVTGYELWRQKRPTCSPRWVPQRRRPPSASARRWGWGRASRAGSAASSATQRSSSSPSHWTWCESLNVMKRGIGKLHLGTAHNMLFFCFSQTTQSQSTKGPSECVGRAERKKVIRWWVGREEGRRHDERARVTGWMERRLSMYKLINQVILWHVPVLSSSFFSANQPPDYFLSLCRARSSYAFTWSLRTLWLNT